VAVVALVGDHDMATADEILSTVQAHAALGRGVVVALTAAEFIDSHVIRVLYLADAEMVKRERRLVIESGPGSKVERVVQIAGIRSQLVCANTLEEAVGLARGLQKTA
jgi:anti-anti-sigma factor